MATTGASKADFVLEHIQATWTDLSNMTRCQFVTKELYESYFKKHGFNQPQFILSLPYMNHPPYGSVAGGLEYFLDDEIPLPLPWLEGVGILFGKFDVAGKPWDCCPRTFLAAQEKKLAALDIKIQVGFELEFFLFNSDGTPLDSTGYGETTALRGKTWQVISGAVGAMKKLGIPVWKYHAEAADSQFEISIGPFEGSMLKAADSLVLARQSIFHVANSFGLKATFAPQPILRGPGSSTHTHVSLWNSKGENLFQVAPGKGKSFLAGIFNNLPNMMPIYCPTGNSYARHGPFGFSGTFHCIGTENRKAAIRVFQNGDLIKRFEVRTPDGTSNPHMVMGSLIGAGMHGIEIGDKLGPFVEVDPYSLPEGSRPRMLPTSMAGGIQEFADSAFNRQLYGKELFKLILQLRRGEEAYWSSAEETMESKMKTLLDKF